MLVRKENKIYRVVEDANQENLRKLMRGVLGYLNGNPKNKCDDYKERMLDEKHYDFEVDKDGVITVEYEPLDWVVVVTPQENNPKAKNKFSITHPNTGYGSRNETEWEPTIEKAAEAVCKSIISRWDYEDDQAYYG